MNHSQPIVRFQVVDPVVVFVISLIHLVSLLAKITPTYLRLELE